MKRINPPSREKERQLLLAYYKEGDLSILGELYQPYMPLIYGLCLKYLKDPGKSEDAVMQIFESLISKLRIHEVEYFRSWIYTFSRNHCLMQLRAKGKEPLYIEDTFMESDHLMHQNNSEDLREEQLQLMEACIEKLKPEQQQVVRLFYLEEKCYKDIVDSTGYELKKVKSYIQNGRRNLKICMEASK